MNSLSAVHELNRDVSTAKTHVVFSGLVLALLIAALDGTIVATALPTIVADLGGLSILPGSC